MRRTCLVRPVMSVPLALGRRYYSPPKALDIHKLAFQLAASVPGVLLPPEHLHVLILPSVVGPFESKRLQVRVASCAITSTRPVLSSRSRHRVINHGYGQ